MASAFIVMMKVFLLLLVFVGFTSFSISEKQSNIYIIKKGGIKVGSLTATKYKEGNVSFYTLTSHSSAWVGTRVWVNHKLKSVYDQNKLIRADVETRSSKGNYTSWVVWKKDHYEYDVRSFSFQRAGRLDTQIDFSIAKLYFEEPLGRKLIFAENHAEIVKLGQQGGHCFQVWTNQQKPSVFYYQNGKPAKIDMVSSSFSYTLELDK